MIVARCRPTRLRGGACEREREREFTAVFGLSCFAERVWMRSRGQNTHTHTQRELESPIPLSGRLEPTKCNTTTHEAHTSQVRVKTKIRCRTRLPSVCCRRHRNACVQCLAWTQLGMDSMGAIRLGLLRESSASSSMQLSSEQRWSRKA